MSWDLNWYIPEASFSAEFLGEPCCTGWMAENRYRPCQRSCVLLPVGEDSVQGSSMHWSSLRDKQGVVPSSILATAFAHQCLRVQLQGSGLSEGDFVTLGANEVEDLQCLVEVRLYTAPAPVLSFSSMHFRALVCSSLDDRMRITYLITAVSPLEYGCETIQVVCGRIP
jgi:hypothetical protein